MYLFLFAAEGAGELAEVCGFFRNLLNVGAGCAMGSSWLDFFLKNLLAPEPLAYRGSKSKTFSL